MKARQAVRVSRLELDAAKQTYVSLDFEKRRVLTLYYILFEQLEERQSG